MKLANIQEITLETHGDERGYLVSCEKGTNLPFDLKRAYYIWGTKEGLVRGLHAHKKLRQLLIAVSGSVEVYCEWKDNKKTVLLDSPEKALLLEGMVWHTMDKFSPNCVLLVLADDTYDESDYIRNYQDFLKEKEIDG